MGKIRTSDNKDKARHVPLYADISAGSGNFRSKPRSKQPTSKENSEGSTVIDSASSRRILQLAKEQQEEIEEEENKSQQQMQPRWNVAAEEESEDEGDASEFEVSEGEYYEEEEEIVDAEDVALFESYFKSQDSNPFGSFNLADKVMAKIEAQKLENNTSSEQLKQKKKEGSILLPPKVIKAYETIGQILTTWTHGKLPKLFKVIPTLKNWEDVLFVTNPSAWSPNACYEATKLFVSNLGARQAESFVTLVLLDRFRSNIEDDEQHKLNYHLYQALKKSLYKPSAFFKGFLFPLVEERCSSREAVIAGSILAKVSIPVIHSSVALSWLTEQEYSPAATVFIRILVEKKYALPYQTIDNLVFYFMKFRIVNGAEAMEDEQPKEAPPLPVVWHKALLAFAQRYKNDITDDQRDFLLETVRQRFHKSIGPEIRRELLAGEPRLAQADAMMDA